MRTREDLFTVHYRRKPDTTKTLPIYAPTKERAYEMAVSFGAVLPKTIYV